VSKHHVHTRRLQLLKNEFFAEGKRLSAAGDPTANCWLCQQPIDYAAPAGTTPASHNLDHYYPVADYPDRQDDPTGWRHSHAKCNQVRGRNAPVTGGLGEQVPAWW
jgi:hypothetical protein